MARGFEFEMYAAQIDPNRAVQSAGKETELLSLLVSVLSVEHRSNRRSQNEKSVLDHATESESFSRYRMSNEEDSSNNKIDTSGSHQPFVGYQELQSPKLDRFDRGAMRMERYAIETQRCRHHGRTTPQFSSCLPRNTLCCVQR